MAAKKLRLNGARRVVVYDTTLRDGAQGSGVSFSVSDKLSISRALDRIGVDYVEGGFPGSNPKDEEFFAAMAGAPLKRARLAAFGATRRAGGTCEDDVNLAALDRSGAPTWTLVGKSDTWQVSTVLQTTNDENLAMIRESVAFGVAKAHEVVFDAEHFFDGYARDPLYALEVCAAAAAAGAAWVVLCDTNGGSLPVQVRRGVEAVAQRLRDARATARVGIHTHNSRWPTRSRASPPAPIWCRAPSTATERGAATPTSSQSWPTWSSSRASRRCRQVAWSGSPTSRAPWPRSPTSRCRLSSRLWGWPRSRTRAASTWRRF